MNAERIVLKRPFSSLAKDRFDFMGHPVRYCHDNAVINNAWQHAQFIIEVYRVAQKSLPLNYRIRNQFKRNFDKDSFSENILPTSLLIN